MSAHLDSKVQTVAEPLTGTGAEGVQAVEGGDPMTVVVDLHGYPVWEAVEVAEAAIEDAYRQPDVDSIMLIHGAPDVYHHTIASQLGRGGIKWSLRGKLARGEWKDWVYGRRSKKHEIEAGYMTLALRREKRCN